MDDLTGLDWNSSQPTPSQKPTSANYYPTLRPTPPISGRSTPAFPPPSAPPTSSAGSALRSNSSTPADDTFAGLVSFNAQKSTKNLSLQEQQKRLEDERLAKQPSLGNNTNTHLGDQDGAFWEALGSGRTTPNTVTSPPKYTATAEYGGHRLSETINKPFANIPTLSSQRKKDTAANVEEDLLSGFSTSINGSSAASQDSKPAAGVRLHDTHAKPFGLTYEEPRPVEEDDLDDDPFGLGMSGFKASQDSEANKQDSRAGDDDDILGLLGRPVSEFPRQPPEQGATREAPSKGVAHPQDSAIADLVDMGFSPEKSREALESTESGTDVQAAVSWLLNQAHQESQKSQASQSKHKGASQPSAERRRSSASRNGNPSPAWQQEEGQRARQNSRSPANSEKDPAKIAAELGNNLFKTANSLWKTGTKKLNQAVSELNSDSDTNQPKWMKDAKLETGSRKPGQQRRGSQPQTDNRNGYADAQRPVAKVEVTDEALMLENGDARPVRKPPSRRKPDVPVWSNDSSRDQSSISKPRSPETRQPRFMQQPQPDHPKPRLNRQLVEEQTSQAYISPARRKKAAPKPPSSESDLLSETSQIPSHPQQPSQTSQPLQKLPQTAPRKTSRPSPSVRPPAPKRHIPSISPTVLQTSNASRLQGSEAFKRGDYGLATTHYTSALSALPSTHPLTIPILTNRALSHSKTGDPKASIADALATVELIGPSRGASETVDLGPEGHREMSLFWGKAMTRQAEALEQLERWAEAASVWRTCVEAGVGGATGIAGRNRCEKAANPSKPRPATAPIKRPPAKPVSKLSALDALSGASAANESTEAVSRLRAANLEAERVDDEKFALSDSVSERVLSWRAGKEGNLRALLASLEMVLWADAGWKKVGMSELILPGKVKVAYMKGIAKVHPDKVCPLQCQSRKLGGQC